MNQPENQEKRESFLDAKRFLANVLAKVSERTNGSRKLLKKDHELERLVITRENVQ